MYEGHAIIPRPGELCMDGFMHMYEIVYATGIPFTAAVKSPRCKKGRWAEESKLIPLHRVVIFRS